MPGGHRKAPNPVGFAALFGGDEISQAVADTVTAFSGLLTDVVQTLDNLGATLIGVDLDHVVIHAVGGP